MTTEQRAEISMWFLDNDPNYTTITARAPKVPALWAQALARYHIDRARVGALR